MKKQTAFEWLEKALRNGLTYEQEQLLQSTIEQAKEMDNQNNEEHITTYNRNTIFTDLTKYDHLAKPNDYMEVCEWHNREGFDVDINGNPGSRFTLTWGQWEALNTLITKLLND